MTVRWSPGPQGRSPLNHPRKWKRGGGWKEVRAVGKVEGAGVAGGFGIWWSLCQEPQNAKKRGGGEEKRRKIRVEERRGKEMKGKKKGRGNGKGKGREEM